MGPGELHPRTPTFAELILVDVPLDFEPVGVWANGFKAPINRLIAG